MKTHRTLSLLCAGSLAIAAPFSSALAEGGYLGVQIDTPSEALRSQLHITPGFGLVVKSVPEGSPAENHLEANDVLLEIDGQKIINADQLITLLDHNDPGKEVEIVLVRKGMEKTLKLPLGERPAELPKPKANAKANSDKASNPLESLFSGMTGQNGENPKIQFHTFGADGDHKVLESLLGGLSGLNGANSGVQVHSFGLDGEEIDNKEIEKMMEELGIDAKGITKQIQEMVTVTTGQAEADVDVAPNTISIVQGIKASANITMNDGTHKIMVKNNGDDKHLMVWDKEGKEIFNGPINTEKQLKAVPKEIRNKIPKMDTASSNIIIKSPSAVEHSENKKTEKE